MKRGFQGEKIAIIILVIIVITTIIFSVYTIYQSNLSLNNNTYSNNSISIQEKKLKSNDKNKSTSTSDDNKEVLKDEMNIDDKTKNKIEEDKQKEVKKEPVQIATYTTTIYDSDPNRISNIELTNSKLNGTIIKPGEEFSFNNTIGPMDESQGFKKALGFDSEGNKIQISGGGICQISSTLYNCVLIANLNVTERHPHSHRVNYVPQDKDATIFYGTYDLKFINTTDREIKIETSNDNVNVTINLVQI